MIGNRKADRITKAIPNKGFSGKLNDIANE